MVPPSAIGTVGRPAHVERLLLILDEIRTRGALLTVERMRVLTHAARASTNRCRPERA
jgi:hypothetical protein